MSLRVLPPGRHAVAGPARAVSYLDDGRQVCWEPGDAAPGRIACDAELVREPRPAIVRAHGLPSEPLGFAVAWTRAEVQAKLADEPVVRWLRTGREPVGDVRTVVLPDAGVVVSLGVLSPAS